MVQSNGNAVGGERSARPTHDDESHHASERREVFKPRERHREPSAPHLGDSHFEKDQVLCDARKVDEGPSFGTPGEPPGLDPDSQAEIEERVQRD